MRTTPLISNAILCIRAYTNHIRHTATRNGTHHIQAGHVGTEQARQEGRVWRRRRRVKPDQLATSSYSNTKHQIHFLFLGQLFFWSCLYAIYKKVGRITCSMVARCCWVGHCHISLPVYRNLREAFSSLIFDNFVFFLSEICVCACCTVSTSHSVDAKITVYSVSNLRTHSSPHKPLPMTNRVIWYIKLSFLLLDIPLEDCTRQQTVL